MLVALFLSAFASFVPVASCGEVRITDVAGGAGDALHVAHVRIAGSSFEIGRELARLGSERHGSKPPKAKDAAATRVQREFFAAKYPAQHERMRGVAAFHGLELAADAFELDTVSYSGLSAGCTVVFYPPATTADGRGVLSRNFDFSTGTFDGRIPRPGETVAVAAPYVLELHPTDAYASLAVVAFDLLGVVDGVNAEGLTVALLADDELFATGQARPSAGAQAGLEVLQVGRFLLDTCKDVAEAKRALTGASLYYTSIPCHYLIADRHGNAFIWENDVDLDRGHVIEGGAEPLVSTNYLRHLHPDPTELPPDPDPLGLFGRHRTLLERFAGQEEFTSDEILANARCVSPCGPAPGRAAGRTLWHALYYPAERQMVVDFYLGEGGGEGAGRAEPRRSAALPFTLERDGTR